MAPPVVTSTNRIGRKGRPSPAPPFIKRGAGGTAPLNPSSPASLHSCPLAMAEEEGKQEWREANGEELRGTVPPAPLFIKGRG